MKTESSDETDEDIEIARVTRWGFAIGGLVTLAVLGYAAAIIYMTWPISKPLSVTSGGVFGDSFGILTALFSGLAFVGIIFTVLLQRIELKLQRKELRENRLEFTKSADAQKKNAQLVALTTLLAEYKSQHSDTLELLREIDSNPSLGGPFGSTSQVLRREKYQKSLDVLMTKRHVVQGMIEAVLIDTGIDIRETAKGIMEK